MTIDQLKFRKNGQRVVIEGNAPPGSKVKVENLSAAPWSRTWHVDNFGSATANNQGRFQIEVPSGVGGDQVKLSAQQGDVVDWLTVRVPGTDTRRAEIAQQALRLVPGPGGSYGFTSVSANTRVGEPHSTFIFTRQRTGEKIRITLDAEGRLPPTATLKGEPGDMWALASTDGTHNPNGGVTYSYLVAPPAPTRVGTRSVIEPSASPDHAGARKIMYTGPLFLNGPTAADPQQGSFGDCWLVASLASIAHTHPEVIKNMITKHRDGTYTVTWKRFDAASGKYVKEPVTVTGELFQAGTYGSSANSKEPEVMELWFPIMEKAYAAWKGGYAATKWGYPFEVFEAVLGVDGRHYNVRDAEPKSLFTAVQKAVRNKEPMVAVSVIDSPAVPLVNTGVVGDHAYSVLGAEVVDGKRLVTLRNPWGSGEPTNNGPDDGVFILEWSDFMRWFDMVGIASH